MLLFRDILALRKVYRKRYGNRLEFYTLDVTNKRIIPVVELLRRKREVRKKSRQVPLASSSQFHINLSECFLEE